MGVQSAIPHPEAEALLAKLMTEKGIPIPAKFAGFDLPDHALRRYQRKEREAAISFPAN